MRFKKLPFYDLKNAIKISHQHVHWGPIGPKLEPNLVNLTTIGLTWVSTEPGTKNCFHFD